MHARKVVLTLWAHQPRAIQLDNRIAYVTRATADMVHALACAGSAGADAAHLAGALDTTVPQVYCRVHDARRRLCRALPGLLWIPSPAAGVYVLLDPWPDLQMEP